MSEQADLKTSGKTLFVVVCGWPLSGKSTLASRLAETLCTRHLDINLNVRAPIFGPPKFESYEEFRETDRKEMIGSYEILLHAAEVLLHLRRSVIVSATFSRKKYQDDLYSFFRRLTQFKIILRIIWCLPTNDPEDEIMRRIESRRANEDLAIACGHSRYTDPVNSVERYLEVKSRYEALDATLLPHLRIDTSAPQTIEDSLRAALTYIRA